MRTAIQITVILAIACLSACTTTQSIEERKNEILVEEINKRTELLNFTIWILDHQNKEVFELRKEIAELKKPQ